MVYVDKMNAGYRRMKMCHMLADTSQELFDMATKIGVNHKWVQHKGTYKEHFDICLSAKRKALALGAKEVTRMEIGNILRLRRSNIVSE